MKYNLVRQLFLSGTQPFEYVHLLFKDLIKKYKSQPLGGARLSSPSMKKKCIVIREITCKTCILLELITKQKCVDLIILHL